MDLDSLGPETPGGLRVAETLAFFEYLEGELPRLMDRWREHRDRTFRQG